MSIMCHKLVRARFVLPPQGRGFSLVSAIFLLVILSALGVFMLSVSTMQQTTSTQDLQGSKAYQAAKAGIEWGAYQILTPENTASATPYACPASKVIPALGGALQGFTVTVGCAPVVAFIEGGNTVRVYHLTSTATLGTAPSSNFVSRSMTVNINTCRVGIVAGGAPCS
jgi:MSHA biogenesis protein MshP